MGSSDLWRRSQRGESDAFGELFRVHARSVYNLLFRAVGDWAVAEDLLSIVFLEAWRRRDLALADDQVRPFLFGVAINVARNQRRSLRRYHAAMRRVPVEHAAPSLSADADARVDDARRYQQALALLNRLGRRQREVFLLCAWSDQTYAEAAFALDIPIGTVRSRLARARASIDRMQASSESPADGYNPA